MVVRRFLAALFAGVLYACGGGGSGQSKDAGNEGQALDSLGDLQDAHVTDQTPAPDPGVKEDVGLPDASVDTGTPDQGNTTDMAVDQGAQGCPAVYTGTECHEMVACALQCSEETYLKQCSAQGSGEELTQYQAVMDCLNGLGDCGPVEDGLFAQCAASCKDQIGACFQGDSDCAAIRKCRVECDPEDPGCPLKCLAEGDADAQRLWEKYVQCIMSVDCAQTDTLSNGWPTQECEKNAQMLYCPKEKQACLNPLG